MTEAKDELMGAFDVPTQVRKHPLGALLVAVAGGLALSGPLLGVIRKQGGALATVAVAFRMVKGLVTSQLISKAFSQLPFARGSTSNDSRDALSRFLASIRV